MTDEKRKLLQPIFDSLEPEKHGISPFPPADDDGDGSDKDLASIIYWGEQGPTEGESAYEFAIALGRKLQAAGL